MMEKYTVVNIKVIRIKYIRLFIFFTVLINLSLSLSTAQPIDLNFKKIIIEVDGEELYTIYSITQDLNGFIWMVTNLGLVRYNGVEGKIYYNYNKNFSIINERIETLFVDSQGDIWIGTKSGLSKYDSGCDCFHQDSVINSDSSLTDIRTITEDKDKNIWIGTGYGGLFKFERESGELTRFLNEPSNLITIVNENIEHLLVDRDNNLWIGTNSYDSKKSSGLIRFNIDSEEIKQFLHEPTNSNSLLDNRISALYEDQKGRILIGTYKCGFHIYDPQNDLLNRINFDTKNPKLLHAPYSEDKVFGNDPYVRLIHQDQNGNYWVGTTGKGINYFDIKAKDFTNYNFNLINPQLLWTIYEDKQGNIWIGGILGCGIFKADLFAKKYNLNTNFINVEAAYESSYNPGILWIKSRKGGLSKVNLKTSEITRYIHDKNNIKSIGHNWVRASYQENKNTLWLGLGNGYAYGGHDGKGGVDRMDIEAETFTHFKLTRDDDGLNGFSYTVYSICEDKEGRLWLSAGPGGIFRSDKNKKEFKHIKVLENDNFSKDVFLNIVRIDSNGNIWASDFAGEGTLYLYNYKEEKFTSYLKGFKMYNLAIDNKGWLIISSWEKGLVHLNPADGNYIHYTKKDGLPSNKALDIVKDENNVFWIGTRMGVAKFVTETGKIYSVGLPKGRYNSGIIKASDGQIYLGVNDGLFSFYPQQVTGNPFPPQLVISDLLISDKKYSVKGNLSDKLNLSYDQNDITFKYIGLHFSNSKKNMYQYRLKPLDKKWINAGFRRTTRYTNLPPGSYTFQVKAANSDGVWNETGKSISLVISPPWWETWWAFTIYIVSLVFSIYGIRRYELNRIRLKNQLKLESVTSEKLRELDQVKSRFFANISHEFRTPLTLILGQINNTLSNKLDGKIKSNLEVANRNAQRLLHLINQLLDLSKIESGNMKLKNVRADIISFTKNIFYSFESLAKEKNISLMCKCEYSSIEIDFEAEKLEKVFLNLLSNAFKFTSEGGKIEIAINYTPLPNVNNGLNRDQFVEITITDTGIGIPAENIPHLFDRFYQVDNTATREYQGTGIGLALTKELVELHGGRINVQSREGKGSTFIIQLPFRDGNLVQGKYPKVESELSQHTLVNENRLYNLLVMDKKKSQSKVASSIKKSDDKEIILVVEDNIDVRNYITEQLISDFQVLGAKDGKEGIALAKKNIPDLIITDVMMPKIDGYELTTNLKQDEKTSHIPIIMLTAKAALDSKIEGLEIGADDYIIKPFNDKELLVRVKNLIALRKQLRSQFSKATIIKPSDVTVVSMDRQFLQKVINVVDKHIADEQFSVDKLADEVNMSVSQLNRKLRALIDQSAGRLIRSMRLQRAVDLLEKNSGTIAEICYQVGFNDQTSFTRAFKKQFGVSPSKYRIKLIKRNNDNPTLS